MAATENAHGPVLHSRAVDHIAMAVGTSKGLFMMSDGRLDGPFFPGERIPAVTVSRSHYLAATQSHYWGTTVRATHDAGVTWSDPEPRPILFPSQYGVALEQVWQLRDDTHNSGVLYAGTEPAALFRSLDGGRSFEIVRSLWDHPDRPFWRSGTAGSALHTVLTHAARPRRIVIGLSVGGVYRSDDSGATWRARNSGLAAPFFPEPHSVKGQCVHKLAVDAGDPDVLWAQGHGGVYRSQDAGDSWTEVSRAGEDDGLPSAFGFPIVAHPSWPSTAYVFPLESEDFPCAAGGCCRVYRTVDAGKSWEPLSIGLPPEGAHITVLRDAFTVGSEHPYPLAFGTRSGEIYASVDGGDSWRLAVRHLPPVLALRILD